MAKTVDNFTTLDPEEDKESMEELILEVEAVLNDPNTKVIHY